MHQEDLLDLLTAEFKSRPIAEHHHAYFNKFLDNALNIITTGFGEIVVNNHPNKRNTTEEDTRIASVSFRIRFLDMKIDTPKVYNNNNTKVLLMPNVARLNDLNYSGPASVTMSVEMWANLHDGTVVEKEKVVLEDHPIGNILIPVGCNKCNTVNMTRSERETVGEDPEDPGAHFIIKGTEWVLDSLENTALNTWHVHIGLFAKELVRGEYISKPGMDFENSSQTKVILQRDGKDNYEFMVELMLNRDSSVYLPFYAVFRLLGVSTDENIIKYIVRDIHSTNGVITNMLGILNLAILNAKSSPIKGIAGMRDVSELACAIFDVTRPSKKGTRIPDTAENAKIKYAEVMKIFDGRMFPHLGTSADDRINKLRFLGAGMRRVLMTHIGIYPPTDRDSLDIKRAHTSGVSYGKVFKTQLNFNVVIPLRAGFISAIEKTSFSQIDLLNVLRTTIRDPKKLERAIAKAITSSSASVKIGEMVSKNRTSSKMNDRRNPQATVALMRLINTPGGGNSKRTKRAEDLRSVHGSQLGYICIVRTAETGEHVGMQKEMAYSASITASSDPYIVEDIVSAMVHDNNTDLIEVERGGYSSVLINGKPVGYVENPFIFADNLRQLRRSGKINYKVSISVNILLKEVQIWTDFGRLSRPILIVYNNLEEYTRSENGSEFKQYIKLTQEMLQAVRDGKMSMTDLADQGVIEYISPDEFKNCYAAPDYNTLIENQNNIECMYTHCDIPQALYGLSALASPMIEKSPKNRTAFLTSQIRQTCGWPSLSYHNRTDKNMMVQHQCRTPLLKTVVNDLIRPSGGNVIVAITTAEGYNQEDSGVGNSGSISRGLFAGTYYTYERATAEKGDIFGIPDPSTTINMRSKELYDKLDGFHAKEGSIIRKGDILIARYALLNRPEGNKTHIATCVVYKYEEPKIVDKVYIGKNHKDKLLCKIRLASYRPFMVGDKYSSRSGGKGILGRIMSIGDSIFTESGVIPDIILSPASFPSRRLGNQIDESLRSVYNAKRGIISDVTGLQGFDEHSLVEELRECGFNHTGMEVMYNGKTGERFIAQIYIGGIQYYLRLQKFILDDNNTSSGGQINLITRQPKKGIRQGGGSRLGEMEGAVIVTHGSMFFLYEKFYEHSDGTRIFICNNCHMRAVVNIEQRLFTCKCTDKFPDIRVVESSHTSKLVIDYIESAGCVGYYYADPKLIPVLEE